MFRQGYRVSSGLKYLLPTPKKNMFGGIFRGGIGELRG